MYFKVVVSLLTLIGKVRSESNYKGRYTRDIKDYEIVVPTKISKDGSFISYYLPHHYNTARVKRGADSGQVYYGVPINGEDRVLELIPSEDFHAPGLVVEHHSKDARYNLDSIRIRKPRPRRCYYHGRVRDAPGSSAAITACSGLAGTIQVGPEQYLIEPVDDEGKPTVDVKHKHLLYKRSQQRTYGNLSKCGTTGSFATALKKRLEWEDKYGKEVEASMKGAFDYDKPMRLEDNENPRKRRFCTTCSPNDIKKCLVPKSPCKVETPLFIEVLLVVGPRVEQAAYLADDVEQFVNTVMNIAVKQFQDGTLGKPFIVKLVRIITIDYLYDELDAKGNNPQQILHNFCKWQTHFNPRFEDHPNHHDYAIYLVKFELCQGEILGLTNMASMCRPDKSCAVVSEEGLLTGIIVTHMMGHALGAEHDDSSTTSCAPIEPDGTMYHMGASISGGSSAWSLCSKQCISQFVKTHAGWCLTDLPTATDLTYPILLPGQVYSAAEQCRINFEINTYACMVGEFCKRLYCKINDKECISMGDPPVQGTKCGPNLWCFNGKCVHRGSRPGATNGEWGEWSSWSHCTKTCGGGIQTSHRSCDAPAPTRGGIMCPGNWLKSKMCNIGGCPDTGRGFLDEQCRRTNNQLYHGRKHEWMYFNQQVDDLQCVVICMNEMNEVAVRNPIAVDGTFCKPAYKDVCIRGSCRPVGCDWIIGSNAKEDACGICHGNGTECRIMQGYFGEHNVQGIIEFLKLPVGTSMVLIRETRPSPCFFFISNSMNRTFYLNSDREEQLFFTGTFVIAGTIGVYQIKGNMERIFIKEPLGVPITISSVCADQEASLGVLYQYALPEPNTPASIPTYTWEFLSWDPCPFPCGGGAQRAVPVCVEAQGGEVEDCFCSQQSRPPDKVRVCNKHPCEAKWWVGPWLSCDCFHEEGVTTRMVMCAQLKEARSTYIMIVPERDCLQDEKPRTQKSCDPVKERELWEKRGWQKRDITDIIPYSEAAEDYTVWDDIAEDKYPSMVNIRKMLHRLDPQKVSDYAYLKKIGMTHSQFEKIHEDGSIQEHGCQVKRHRRVRRQKVNSEPTKGKKRVNIKNEPEKGAKHVLLVSKKKSLTKTWKNPLLKEHKAVKAVNHTEKEPRTTAKMTAKTTARTTAKTTARTIAKTSTVGMTTKRTTKNVKAVNTTTNPHHLRNKVQKIEAPSAANVTANETVRRIVGASGKAEHTPTVEAHKVNATTSRPTLRATTNGRIKEERKQATAATFPASSPIPEVIGDPGLPPHKEIATDSSATERQCWRAEMKMSRQHPTCLPPGEAVLEPAEAPPEIDFLNTSNIKIYVVPIMTTVQTIIQNDQEYVLLDTLAKWPVADELSVVEHWGDAARRELKLARDRIGKKDKKKISIIQD